MKKFTYLILVIVLMNLGTNACAQLYKVNMDEKVSNATLIIEGKVIAKTCFWNSAHTLIYTANTIELYKSFKGVILPGVIEILTQGGSVGNDFIEVSDLARLTIGDKGIFFLFPNLNSLVSPVSGRLLYDIYASDQGVLRYSIADNKAVCPFEEYTGITTSLYNTITSLTGPYALLNPQYSVNDEIADTHSPRPQTGNVISSSPSTVNAGAIMDQANNILTIKGAGFGNNPSGGKALLFKDGDKDLTYPSFVVEYNSPYVISWENTEIKVRVPARAANGPFGVYLGPGDTSYAPQPLKVNYSVLDAIFNGANGLQEPRLTSMNGTGGYNIVYSTSTAGGGVNITGSPVYNTFRRALTTWKEIAGLNFAEAGNTTTQTANALDAQNIIMLDNTNTGVPVLPAGVLAATYNGFDICPPPPNAVAQKKGFDIIIRNSGVSAGNASFDNGPCPPPFSPSAPANAPHDMETVLLHELGHALNLAHINESSRLASPPFNFADYRNPASVMHYASSSYDVRRTPDAAAYQGSLYTVTPRGNTSGFCSPTTAEMMALATQVPANDNCPLIFPTSPTPSGTFFTIDLVNATSNSAVDPQFTHVSCTQAVSITNNVYQVIRTNQAGALAIAVSNYATVPSGVAASCDTNQGVRLAVYDVASCPAGQAFPAPKACYTIKGNGMLPMLTGLGANKTYLLFFEGVRNTKAKLSVELRGGTLPIKLLSFTGKNINRSTNALSIAIAEAVNVLSVAVERSTDSRNFTSLGLLRKTSNSYNGLHNFTDANALDGTSYYRLKTTDVNNSVEYSDILSLTTAGNIAISLQPNPFNSFITVKAQDNRSKLTVIISDVVLKKINQSTFLGNTQISTSGLGKGTYFVSVYDANGQLLTTKKMLKD